MIAHARTVARAWPLALVPLVGLALVLFPSAAAWTAAPPASAMCSASLSVVISPCQHGSCDPAAISVGDTVTFQASHVEPWPWNAAGQV